MTNFSTSTDVIRVLVVPTIMHKPQQKQEIDIKQMSANDLDTLRRKDPFLYHSIPQVNKATLSIKTVDHSKVLKDTASTLQASSSPSDDASSSSSSSSCSTNTMIVSRKTRITTEVAPSMLLDELIYDEGLDTSTSSNTDDDSSSEEECCSSIAILDELMDSVRDYNFPSHYTEEHLGQ